MIFDETIEESLLPQVVLSSASLPGALAPQYINGRTLVDGGVFTNLDLSEGILKCREMGFDDKDIIMDIILCFEKKTEMDEWSAQEAKYKNAYDIYQRKEWYRYFYYYYEDITRVIRGYPNVHFRHLITPQATLGGGYIPLFDGIDTTRRYMEQGYNDAVKSLNNYYRNKDNDDSK